MKCHFPSWHVYRENEKDEVRYFHTFHNKKIMKFVFSFCHIFKGRDASLHHFKSTPAENDEERAYQVNFEEV